MNNPQRPGIVECIRLWLCRLLKCAPVGGSTPQSEGEVPEVERQRIVVQLAPGAMPRAFVRAAATVVQGPGQRPDQRPDQRPHDGPDGLQVLGEILKENAPRAAVGPIFDSIRPERLAVLVSRAQTYWARRGQDFDPRFEAYYEILLRASRVEAEQLVETIRARLGVRAAAVYLDIAVESPCAPRTSNTSGYVDAPSAGTNATSAWNGGFCGSAVKPDGRQLTVAVIDKGWFQGQTPHPYLPPVVAAGTGVVSTQPLDVSHGTGAIGVVGAIGAEPSITGVASGAQVTFVPGRYPGSLFAQTKVDKAITEATDVMSSGDIVLVEFQVGVPGLPGANAPVEVQKAAFDAVQLAVGNGIIVVEPAGNRPLGTTVVEKTLDLAQYANVQGRPGANINDPNFDSGAIIVAAAHAAVEMAGATACHRPMAMTNHGGRVDAYGWGDSIITTSAAGNTPLPDVPNVMGLTSGASAIIAGAAAIIQHMAMADPNRGGQPLDAHTLRGLLRAHGTPVIDSGSGSVFGILPDLSLIQTNIP